MYLFILIVTLKVLSLRLHKDRKKSRVLHPQGRRPQKMNKVSSCKLPTRSVCRLVLFGYVFIAVGLARFSNDTNVRAENVPTCVGNADLPIMYHTDLCR